LAVDNLMRERVGPNLRKTRWPSLLPILAWR
jgi:hypothetical protein